MTGFHSKIFKYNRIYSNLKDEVIGDVPNVTNTWKCEFFTKTFPPPQATLIERVYMTKKLAHGLVFHIQSKHY